MMSSCEIFDFSKPTLVGKNQEYFKPDIQSDDSSDFYFSIQYGRQHKYLIIPFFSIEWSGKYYGIEFNFSTNNEKYQKIDSVNYEIKYNDSLFISGIVKNYHRVFTCYTDSGYYGRHTRCYTMLTSDFNMKKKFIDSTNYIANFEVYLTNRNGNKIMLKSSDCNLLLIEKKKIDLMIVPNY